MLTYVKAFRLQLKPLPLHLQSSQHLRLPRFLGHNFMRIGCASLEPDSVSRLSPASGIQLRDMLSVLKSQFACASTEPAMSAMLPLASPKNAPSAGICAVPSAFATHPGVLKRKRQQAGSTELLSSRSTRMMLLLCLIMATSLRLRRWSLLGPARRVVKILCTRSLASV